MGLVKSYFALTAMARESEKNHDVKADLSTMQAKMTQANAAIVAQTRSAQMANDPASQFRRVSATATVVSVTRTGTMVNEDSLFQVQLIVMLPGGIAVPTSVTQLVSPLNLPRIAVSSQLPVTLDPKAPESLAIQW